MQSQAMLSILLSAICVNAQIFANESAFPSLDSFKAQLAVQGNLGLRSTASPRQYALSNHIISELIKIRGVDLEESSFDLYKWQTLNDYSLFEAGSLSLTTGTSNQTIPVAGAIPYAAPGKRSGPLIYVPPGANISSYNVSGKIVIRDFTFTGTAYSLLFALVGLYPEYYRTNDTNDLAGTSYDRPFTVSPNADMIAATSAGAVGFISAFNVTRTSIQSYWDPHEGTHQKIPGVYVGADELVTLKQAAQQGQIATVGVDAFAEVAYTKEIFATLPGTTNETIVIVTHTDGNTFVQDNGVVALLELARYFAALPMSSRRKTLQFAFTSGHLSYSRDGNYPLARKIDFEYDRGGNVALVVAMEHMGTNEILPVARRDGGPGQNLTLTGRGEIMLWSVGPMQQVIDAAKAAVVHRRLDNIVVAPGLSVPNNSQVPTISSFGGIGTGYHQYLVPTTSIISGPWSLWAPKFGASAVNITRLRDQTLAFADMILSIDGLSKSQIAGNYTAWRALRAGGYPSPAVELPPQFVDDYWPVLDGVTPV